jgi:hypothetical protein
MSLLAEARDADGQPETWGPPLWTLLHHLAERIGKSGVPLLDTDQARDMDKVVTLLPFVIPCAECQAHCRAYLAAHPFTSINYTGSALSVYVRTWLLDFHNAVRTANKQELEVTTLEALEALYHETPPPCHIEAFGSNVLYGIRNNLVKLDSWKRWIVAYKRLKVLAGA